jgi:hypothetical protein
MAVLDLARTNISNIGPLSALPSLSSLNLAFTKVGDLTPLEELAASLVTVDLRGCEMATAGQKDALKQAMPGLKITDWKQSAAFAM